MQSPFEYVPIAVNAQNYVVFDVETNGLKSKEDDLLSISFYKPDDNLFFNRFLPLELSKSVKTTKYNGIKTEDLKDEQPLTQEEFNQLVSDFELTKRTILTFSGRNFDEIFLREYLKRKHIKGYDQLTFYNIKKLFISSRFSGGNVTKDNLCKMFGIENVTKVHSSANDCRLEWELFAKTEGYYYLITEGKDGDDNVFRMTPDYIIPVSLFNSHPGLSKLVYNRPYINCESLIKWSFEINAAGIKKFETNFNGMIIEHLIDIMLQVQEQDSENFLLENKKKLIFVGKIPSSYNFVPLDFNDDGSVTAIKKKDKQKEIELNATISLLKKQIQPLIDYIKWEIFKGKQIMAQELVINKDYNILALCDLSSDDAILEIKTNIINAEKYKEQFFYEANGRTCYHLQMDWQRDERTFQLNRLVFILSEVKTSIGIPPSGGWTKSRKEEQRINTTRKLEERLSTYRIHVVNYTDTHMPVRLKCCVCEKEWGVSYYSASKGKIQCPDCKSTLSYNQQGMKRKYATEEERKKASAEKYENKIEKASGGLILILDYCDSRTNVTAQCKVCGNKWSIRPDHLLAKCYCPKCKKRNRQQLSLLDL